ncbi:hypothetical protein [Mycobacterium uberis]|nr:hypothetical protein [Mycobacterium uberis]
MVSAPKSLLLAMNSRQWSTLGPDQIEKAVAAGKEVVWIARIADDRDMEF